MIIVIEGLDCVGKSTLINEIVKKYKNAKIIKATNPPKSKKEKENIIIQYETILRVLNQPNLQNEIFILDRFHPSEYAYSKIKRNYNPSKKIWNIDLIISKKINAYFYCYLDKTNHLIRLKKRGDDYLKIKDIDKIKKRYEEFNKKTKMNMFEIDMTYTPEKIGKKVINFIRGTNNGKRKNIL